MRRRQISRCRFSVPKFDYLLTRRIFGVAADADMRSNDSRLGAATALILAAAFGASPCAADSSLIASNPLMNVDMDAVRYGGPARARVQIRVDDVPRRLVIDEKSAIVCVQLSTRSPGEIVARIRRLSGQSSTIEEIRIAGAAVAPGTFRTTSWGLLLRLVVTLPFGPDGVKQFDRTIDAGQSPPCDLQQSMS
jgi:hypothetical protein